MCRYQVSWTLSEAAKLGFTGQTLGRYPLDLIVVLFKDGVEAARFADWRKAQAWIEAERRRA